MAEGTSGNQGRNRFKYRIINALRDPLFDESMEMDIVDGKPLIYYMERAVDLERTRFTGFTVKYFAELGYFITAINGVSENYNVDKSYWQIRTQQGKTPVGISAFIPEADMEVTIELVKEEDGDKCA